ncbi:MAG: carbamoyltransferase HypF, partial [Methylocystis sp.]
MAYADAARTAPQRLRVRVRGAVQGVGFRPFVHDLATRLRLDGFVKNDAAGVLLEVQGERIDAFLDALSRRPPPLARVEAMEVEELPSRQSSRFVILDSVGGVSETRIVPDAAVCEDCLDELFDPASRFHLYPFVTCTHCGPRYTLTRRLPYDRAQTSMAPFVMCRDCASDYRDPANRRFHAEPVCCPECGPKLSASPADIVAALRAGKIVATKGVGGFHLMCDARNGAAVEELRRRKARDAKPFAVMTANVSSVASIARPTEQELALVQALARPLVLMQSRGVLVEAVAPRLNRIGVMLPYAPLHHLIFHAAAGAPMTRAWRDAPQELTLVATSANLGGDPLVKDNADARARLADIADLIVMHDREIVTRIDDSVMSVVAGAPAFLRRARGFVPEPIELGADGPCVIAAGAHLKATITVTRGREAFVSQHIGDLSNAATGRFYRETVQRFIDLL